MFGKVENRRVRAAVSALLVTCLLAACAPASSVRPKVDYLQVPEVIAVIADFGSGKPAQRRVSNMVASFNPSFVVTAGDNVYEKQNYEDEVRDYYPQKLVPATGNHDYDNGISKFDEFFGIDRNNRNYVYQAQSGVDFFLLDSTAGLASRAARLQQKTWLTKELSLSEANFKVVVLHHPPYSSGKHGSTKRYQWSYAEMGADLVISGHDHTYERISRRGGMYVVAGTGGAKLYKCGKPVYGSIICQDKRYGALFLYVNSFQLRGVFRTSTGETLDTFTMSK